MYVIKILIELKLKNSQNNINININFNIKRLNMKSAEWFCRWKQHVYFRNILVNLSLFI